MILVTELKRWLDTLTKGDCVYVDDDGLTLKSELDQNAYLEVGGLEYGDDNEIHDGSLPEYGDDDPEPPISGLIED
ncbi:MAG: hypothetical protein EBW87_06325 [Burkholderiaceae bacterium]|nr:hypothetical protein [Burkholderiaceae bacterium]